jgi:hypothetical protein
MPLNFEIKGENETRSCIAFTFGIDGQKFESPKIDIQMAIAEGWMNKTGSKWKTMPDLMLRYRAAAFFGRLYCPELLMGMQSEDEIIDVYSKPIKIDKVEERIEMMLNDCQTIEDINQFQEMLITEKHILTAEQNELFSNKIKEVANGKSK